PPPPCVPGPAAGSVPASRRLHEAPTGSPLIRALLLLEAVLTAPPPARPLPPLTGDTEDAEQPALRKPSPSPLPPCAVIKSARARIVFDVKELGHSKVGKAEVYFTADDGANWEEVRPESGKLPRGEGKELAGSVVVKVPREGVVFGYYVVVKN